MPKRVNEAINALTLTAEQKKAYAEAKRNVQALRSEMKQAARAFLTQKQADTLFSAAADKKKKPQAKRR